MGQNISVKGFKFTLTWILLSTLTGCSIYDENYMMRVATPPNYDEINQYVEDWKDTNEKVERLSDLESDLALVIAEVGKLSSLKNVPLQYEEPQTREFEEVEYDNINRVNSVVKNTSMPPLPYEATNVDSIRQTYAAHLAFYLRKDSAQVGWRVLKKSYPEILNGLTPVVKKIVRNQQTIYSLRVGPFVNEDGAKEMCSIFNHYKYKCEPMDFSGNKFLSTAVALVL
jgi:hypothetical protein